MTSNSGYVAPRAGLIAFVIRLGRRVPTAAAAIQCMPPLAPLVRGLRGDTCAGLNPSCCDFVYLLFMSHLACVYAYSEP